MLLTPAVLLSLLTAVSGFNVCLNRDQCVSVIPPYSGSPQRPFLHIPIDPTVRFFLYNPADLDHPTEVFSNSSSISSSSFNPKVKTYFTIHGYTLTAHEKIITDLTKAVQGAEDCNVFAVDWGSVSWIPYLQAVQTTQFIGMKIANFIQIIEELFGYPGFNITLMGHSLGAHIAGFTGNHHKGIGRIICMDPAGPGFEGVPEVARLNMNSATFVHCFHSNAGTMEELRLGYIGALGHIDNFMNGGSQMPECLINIPALLEKQVKCLIGAITGPVVCPTIFPSPEECEPTTGFLIVSKELLKFSTVALFCDHHQILRYYMDMIHNPQNYKGQPCKDVESCRKGETEPCPDSGCVTIGHFTEAPTDGREIYYVRTALPPAIVSTALDLVSLAVDAAGNVIGDPAEAIQGTADVGEAGVDSVITEVDEILSG